MLRLGLKTKLTMSAVAALLILGVCVLLWHSQQSGQGIQLSSEATQETSAKSLKETGDNQQSSAKTVQKAAVSSTADSEQDEVVEATEKERWSDMTDEEWEAMNELLSALDASDKESSDEEQEKDDEAERQAQAAYWHQEVLSLTTSYRDLMERGRSAILNGPEAEAPGPERRQTERGRERILCDAMNAILRYVAYSDDYSGVSEGGWADEIWGKYVRVRVYPPSETEDVPHADVMPLLVF